MVGLKFLIQFKLIRLNYYFLKYRYPPESIKKDQFTSKSDIWSYGVTVRLFLSYFELNQVIFLNH